MFIGLSLLSLFCTAACDQAWVFVGEGECEDDIVECSGELFRLPIDDPDHPDCHLFVDKFPIIVDGEGATAATVLDGKIFMCAASFDQIDYEMFCSSLDPVSGKWEDSDSHVPTSLLDHGSSMFNLPDGNLMMIGCCDDDCRSDFCPRTAIYKPGENQWVPGPLFPPLEPIACTAQINETHTLITGIDALGMGEWGITMGDPFTYLFDGSEFHRKADPQLQWNGESVCSVMADGRVMLVGGTEQTNSTNNVRIYNPLENTWMDGPSIPVEAIGAMILDENDVILIENNSFYRLSLFSDEWETLDTKLANGKAWFDAVRFENSNINC